ncbi:MAG: phosphotransferase, partial [Bacteroidales bacterium]|nr:phosphotransferase [Bacteroidales bacterium]
METVTELTPSGSNRQYFRVQDGDRSFIRVVGKDRDENRAFIALSNHFSAKGIRVPKVLEVSPDGMSYTQEDLGDDLLYDLCAQGRASGEYSPAEEALL